MAHKWSLFSTASGTDRLFRMAGGGTLHLSDGTLIFLAYDPSIPSWKLYYTTDRTTVNLIGTIDSQLGNTGGTNFALTLARDNLDNLYVVGMGTTKGAVRCQAWSKNGGYAWTGQTAVSTSVLWASGSDAKSVAATWCNTGGGTNTKGHIMVIGVDATPNPCYAILDAGIALAGSGTLNTAGGISPTFLSSVAIDGGIDISNDGFGVASGIAALYRSATAVTVGAWAVGSTGVLSTNTNITTALTTSGAGAAVKLRVIRVSSNVWAVIYKDSAATNKLLLARYSATAQLTAPATWGAVTDMPTPAATLNWGAAYDSLFGKIWVFGWHATTATTVVRLGCAVAAGITWDAAKQDDDTAVGTTSSTTFRMVKEPVNPVFVDYQAWNNGPANKPLIGNNSAFNVPPNAPTLTAPANGSTQDLAAGYTFTWTFSDPNAGDTQSAYALRRKVGAGAYEYWNDGTASWQSTEVYNANVAGSVTFAAGKWTNGTTYQWSVATKDSFGVAGPYASDFTILSSTAAVVTVTQPTGSVTTSTQPDVVWSLADVESDAQQTYQIKVESGAYSTTPGSGTSVWDSTETSSSTTRNRQIGVVLTNGTTYRAFVRVSTNGQYSGWSYTTFTISLDAPAAPTMTATPDNSNNRIALVVSGHDNLLDANTASIEVDATGWTVDANCTLARSTADADNGSASLQMTSVAGGDMRARTTTRYPVTVGVTYTAIAKARAAASPRNTRVLARWYTAISGGSLVATTTGASVADAVGSYTQTPAAQAAAPATTLYVELVLEVLATGGAAEVHRWDSISVAPGTSTTWTRGGLAAITTPVVQYSDDAGVTWANVRGTPAATFDAPATQQLTVYDYEAKPYKQRQYRPLTQVNV